jgi:hypothetical protein
MATQRELDECIASIQPGRKLTLSSAEFKLSKGQLAKILTKANDVQAGEVAVREKDYDQFDGCFLDGIYSKIVWV